MARLDIRNLSKRQRVKLHGYVRAGIQLFYFLLIPGAFTAAFNGVKFIGTAVGSNKPLELSAFVMALAGLCAFTIVFGRFFCGFACAFGSFGDALHGIYTWICKKRKKKVKQLPPRLIAVCSALKYVVLAAIVFMCYKGIYGQARGTSPWDVFSMFRARNIQLSGYTVGVVILLLLMAGMFFQERFFCRCFCPMGAVFSLLPVLPFFSLQRDRDHCRPGCSACTMRCPSDIELPKNGSPAVMGDCFQCQKCVDTCPQGNVHIGLNILRGNEVIYTVVRAVLLFILLKWLGM